jgi:hypothetical protein
MNLVEAPPGLPTTNRFAALQMNEDQETDILEEFVDEMPAKEDWQTVDRKKKSKKTWKKVTHEYFCNACKCDEKECKQKMPTKQLNVLFDNPPTQELQDLNNVSTSRWLKTDPATGWRRVTSVVDSGASDSVAPLSLAPEVEMRESPGSKRGQTYSGASPGGKEMRNHGEKELAMVTKEGQETSATWQMVDVNRPLSAVRRMCKQGNRVIFGQYGGVIQNIETGAEIPFEVEDEIYVMELWLPPAEPQSIMNEAGFPRLAR